MKRRSKYRRRDRDLDYMIAVKRLPCIARALSACEGVIEADHAGRRSVGRKAPDDTCVPVCTLHHRQRGDFSGPFRDWTGAQMREWLDAAIASTRQALNRMPDTGTESPQGIAHYAWKGDGAATTTKRNRAQRRYKLGPCVECGRPGRDRHHVDGDTGNNTPDNVKVLCRRCHMKADGRLDAFKQGQRKIAARLRQPDRACRVCQRMSSPKRLWRGRCHRCHEYWRRNGVDRPWGKVDGHQAKTAERAQLHRIGTCLDCHRQLSELKTKPVRGRCVVCYRRLLENEKESA